jgi:arabinan endo-1,5-alpha-L-arabinosidase
MKKLSKLLLSVGIVSITFSCNNEKDNLKVSNETPAASWALTGNVVSHDPCIVKEGNTWWAFMTGTGIGIKYSSNGLNWTQGTQRFPSALSWWKTYAPNMGNNDIWAPDCFYHNGRYWLYYSVSEFGKNNSAIGLTSCSSISKGDWRDDGMVISSKSGSQNYNAIDPNITRDASGALWMSFGSWFDGIKVVKLNTSTMKPTGSIYTLARKSGGIEASDIVYNGGYYYLFVSIGACCKGTSSTYKIAYGRSSSITGPYTDKNGTNMLNGGGTILDAGNSRWIGPGAQDIFKNGSNFVLIRHAYDATDNGTPKMLISDLYFKSGWPTY